MISLAYSAVHMCRCDVGDINACHQVAEWVREHLPAVQTYAHAAGSIGHSEVLAMTPEAHWAVCQAKVTGAGFGEAVGALELHLFSSTAAVWSQPGAAHYSAGNAYLDEHAAACRLFLHPLGQSSWCKSDSCMYADMTASWQGSLLCWLFPLATSAD